MSSTLPAMFVASLAPGHYLREALQTVQSTEQAETISQDLAALANRLLSVYSVTPGDLEKVEPALEEMRDTLNLSLEHLTQGQDGLAGGVFQRHDVQGLFKIGFNLISQLRDQADRIFRRGNLSLERSEEVLLEFPEAEFYSGIKRLRPLFFEGIEDPGKSSYRHFQSLADLERAKELLDQIDLMSAAFWQVVGISAGEFPVGLFNVSRKELRFSQIFNTAVINYLIGGLFVPSALSPGELSQFLKDDGLDLSRLTGRLLSVAEKRVQKAVNDPAQSTLVRQFGRRWVTACAGELFPLAGNRQVDPRFIRSVVLRLS